MVENLEKLYKIKKNTSKEKDEYKSCDDTLFLMVF